MSCPLPNDRVSFGVPGNLESTFGTEISRDTRNVYGGVVDGPNAVLCCAGCVDYTKRSMERLEHGERISRGRW